MGDEIKGERKMTDKIFNFLRFFAEVVIPALVTLLGVVFCYFPCDKSEAILAIVGAIGVFIAAVVGKARSDFNKRNGV